MKNDNRKILNNAQQLFDDVKSANISFKKKTDSMLDDINDEAKKVADEFSVSEKELKNIEKDTVNKIDATVLDFVVEADKILKEEK